MKPLGRKHYKDKTGGKHKPRGAVPFWFNHEAWWENLIEPSKKRSRQQAKKEIERDL